MLYATPQLTSDDRRVLDEITTMSELLQPMVRPTRTWSGSLRRELFARNIQASIMIEGYQTSVADVESMIAGGEPLDSTKANLREAEGYRQALSWVLRLAGAQDFAYSDGLLNGMHYMIAGHHPRTESGWWRTTGVWVGGGARGQIAYEAPDADRVPGLISELIDWLNGGDLDSPTLVRAAMAHLNLVSIHPWRDGNGRMSRALHTLLIARDGLLAPEFSSIEEWIGYHPRDYYDALRTGGRVWSPEREAGPWVRYVLAAHHQQLQLVRNRVKTQSDLWFALEEAIRRQGWDERFAYALFPTIRDGELEGEVTGLVHRAAYQADAGISEQAAQADLRTLVRASWLDGVGAGRGRYYKAGPQLPAELKSLVKPVFVLDPYEG
ncbi:Fic family protein [Longispora albida]|uniref:Fic family protein n=1 Tax=Longispora albida TaxID=203523 RepID=UPI0003828DB7|nr:Fic family protein [Longispora albida]